jgi:hypothetical protein
MIPLQYGITNLDANTTLNGQDKVEKLVKMCLSRYRADQVQRAVAQAMGPSRHSYATLYSYLWLV